MALTEKVVIDKIEVLENGFIQVREATVIEKDGVELTRSFGRQTLSPGQDLTGQSPKVVAIANVVWTDEVVAQYRASQAPVVARITPAGEPLLETPAEPVAPVGAVLMPPPPEPAPAEPEPAPAEPEPTPEEPVEAEE